MVRMGKREGTRRKRREKGKRGEMVERGKGGERKERGIQPDTRPIHISNLFARSCDFEYWL